MGRKITIQFDSHPDVTYENVPDDVTPEAVITRAQKDVPNAEITHVVRERTDQATKADYEGKPLQSVVDLGGGVIKGLSNVANTLLSPNNDRYTDMRGKQHDYYAEGTDPRTQSTNSLKAQGVNTESLAYDMGRLGSEAAITYPVGGLIGSAGKGLNTLFPGLESVLPASNLAGKVAKSVGGLLETGVQNAAVGAGTAALVNPDEALAGALSGSAVGGLLHVGGRLADPVTKALYPKMKAKGMLADALAEGGGIGNLPAIEGVAPTTGMLAAANGNRQLMALEQNARLKNQVAYSERDAANRAALYKNLDKEGATKAEVSHAINTAMDQLKPVKDAVLAQAEQHGGYLPALRNFTTAKMQEPGVRDSSAEPIYTRVMKTLAIDEVKPADVLKLRQELTDSLKLKSGADTSDFKSAARDNRRLTTELVGKIDESLDASTQGGWSQYQTTVANALKPISSKEAVTKITSAFAKKSPIPGTDIPAMSAYGLRSAHKKSGETNLGSRIEDKLIDSQREAYKATLAHLDALEAARAGNMATSGSQTAPYALGLQSTARSLIPYPFKGWTDNILSNHDAEVNGLLADALLNPTQLKALLGNALKPKFNHHKTASLLGVLAGDYGSR